MTPHTSRTVHDPERLRVEVGKMRADGHALASGEPEQGLRTLVMPGEPG